MEGGERQRERERRYVIGGLGTVGVSFGTVMCAVKDRIELLGLGLRLRVTRARVREVERRREKMGGRRAGG
jgi:hypothetical protein